MKMIVLTLILLSVFLPSCTKTVDTLPATPGDNIKFETLLIGSHSGWSDKAQNIVIKSKQEETDFLNKFPVSQTDENGNPVKITLPAVDYSKDMLLAMNYGMTSSGSYSFAITGASVENGNIQVNSTLSIPVGFVTTDIGNPAHVIKIAKSDLHIVFQKTKNDTIKIQNSELAGTKWQWYSMVNNDGSTSLLSQIETFKYDPYFKPELFTIIFKSESEFEGTAGCNTYSGFYKIEHDGFSSSGIGMTEVNCMFTSGFVGCIHNAYSFTLEGKMLRLNAKDADFTALIFERK